MHKSVWSKLSGQMQTAQYCGTESKGHATVEQSAWQAPPVFLGTSYTI